MQSLQIFDTFSIDKVNSECTNVALFPMNNHPLGVLRVSSVINTVNGFQVYVGVNGKHLLLKETFNEIGWGSEGSWLYIINP